MNSYLRSTPPSVTTVLIVEDEPIFRLGLLTVLRPHTDRVKVIAEASNCEDAVSLAQEHTPDVVLLDLRLPQRRGLGAPALEYGVSAIEQIASLPHPPRIVILSYLKDANAVFQALKAGAFGYIAKDDHFYGQELAETIKKIACGEAIYGPTVANLIRQFFADPTVGNETGAEKLTPREQEVLDLLAQGKSNDEIKESLVISEGTVKTHVSNILAKLHLKSRHQVYWYAAFQRQSKGIQ